LDSDLDFLVSAGLGLGLGLEGSGLGLGLGLGYWWTCYKSGRDLLVKDVFFIVSLGVVQFGTDGRAYSVR